MPLISIVTAAYAPTAHYLPDTMASVAAQTLPGGWEMEWIVQEDGPNSHVAGILRSLDIVQHRANGAKLGIAPTRNLALSRVSGTLVQALDQDDILLPGAIATLIPRFIENPIHWAVGQADDLLPDGTRRAYPSDIDFGLQPAGRVNKWAEQHGGNWPIHCAALMMRTNSLRALGGWTGIPYDDEVALFAGLSEVTDGYYEREIIWLYRHHSLQTHRTELSQAQSENGRRVALQRARAARVSGLRFDISALDDAGDSLANVRIAPALKDQATER